ncbi:hypothetical protein HOLleu_38644 [Holothuria leucospilota]|uniref:Uncharacterized protein n=1 Tax=Holothuria leucospilota TaxID=206669 RepID=A0A9Q0YEM7_HOLLE|nr:hypothetical protein HOLleu_38644 [Holothuria leucospilota]
MTSLLRQNIAVNFGESKVFLGSPYWTGPGIEPRTSRLLSSIDSDTCCIPTHCKLLDEYVIEVLNATSRVWDYLTAGHSTCARKQGVFVLALRGKHSSAHHIFDWGTKPPALPLPMPTVC